MSGMLMPSSSGLPPIPPEQNWAPPLREPRTFIVPDTREPPTESDRFAQLIWDDPDNLEET